ncbi:hypothetical protein DPMN_015836 [Dreissena polymorpha]|uniref:Uncharacterized protein n=1 Tax=Dreissena polymorpha TaxID=45954 RepID=A0A9D4NC69_DREPO|nr:hypothetical protein DPMN_015836 [Dreissena polymorpha]
MHDKSTYIGRGNRQNDCGYKRIKTQIRYPAKLFINERPIKDIVHQNKHLKLHTPAKCSNRIHYYSDIYIYHQSPGLEQKAQTTPTTTNNKNVETEVFSKTQSDTTMHNAPSTDKPQYREQSHECAAEPPLREQTPENRYKQHQETTQHIRTASASRGRTTTKSNVLNNTMKNKTTQGPPTPHTTQKNRSASIIRTRGNPNPMHPNDVNNQNSINTLTAATDQ